MKILTEDIVKKEVLTEADIKLLCKRANAGEKINFKLEDLARDIGYYQLTPEQNKKGYDYLIDQWKTPAGVERKNNPFGYREQEALEHFKCFEFVELYNAGNAYHNFFVPLYTVVCHRGEGENYETYTGFQYYMAGGKINIIG